MPRASCLCGNFKLEFTGQPAAKVSCHCLPCRKSSGTMNSLNLIVPDSQVKVLSGAPKEWTRKGDSGGNVTYYACINCPTIMYVRAEAIPGIYILKLGTFEDQAEIEQLGPEQEIYTKNRVSWTKPFECPQILGAQ